MLWNPKFDNPTFHGVSLREFIAWLETKDPAEPYDYGNPLKCATAQFLESTGAVDRAVQFWSNDSAEGRWLWNIVSSFYGPTTFGAALERARAALASA